MNTPYALVADGIEQQFAINLPGSLTHEQHPKGGIHFDSINDEKISNPGARFGRSKLTSLLLGKALARCLKD
ncbi:hypothetical protein BGZ81_008844 [Podila clonocystis]|nr:hypothetical protein BGZ81_008844 [Podila clonocystis]